MLCEGMAYVMAIITDIIATFAELCLADVMPVCGRQNSHCCIRMAYFMFWDVKHSLIPMFWLRYGLLPLVYVDSFTVQEEALVLLPHYTEVVNCCGVTCDVTMVIYRGGGMGCSLNLSPKVHEDSPRYSS